jgi:NAD(P)-dependent dehydrogenase (short-subunit alcohol dehydrogenase family)
LGILVNNAKMGVAARSTRLEDFERCFAVNVPGAFVAVQAAAGYSEHGGQIIPFRGPPRRRTRLRSAIPASREMSPP